MSPDQSETSLRYANKPRSNSFTDPARSRQRLPNHFEIFIKFAQAIRAELASWKTMARSPMYPSMILSRAEYASLKL